MPNKSLWPLMVAWNEWIYANLNFKNCWCNVRCRWQFAAEKFLVIVSDVMAFWFRFFILWLLCLRQLDLWLREKDRRAEEQWREPTSSDSQFEPFTFQLFPLHSNFPKNSIFLKKIEFEFFSNGELSRFISIFPRPSPPGGTWWI